MFYAHLMTQFLTIWFLSFVALGVLAFVGVMLHHISEKLTGDPESQLAITLTIAMTALIPAIVVWNAM